MSRKYIVFTLAVLLFLFLWLANPLHLAVASAKTLAIAALMITLWVGEAMPMPVVALLPLILFPLLGVATTEDVAKPYANSIIFLFLGGFMLGLAIEKWNLHKRIALNILRITGTSGNRIVLGFVLATGLLSMWLSNTATTMMMYPIAMSVVNVMEQGKQGQKAYNNLAVCLLLAIAYASNFGGIATIIGTPPNVAYVAFLKTHDNYIFQFTEWMLLCFPLSLLLLWLLYLVMTKWLFRNNIGDNAETRQLVQDELQKLGRISSAEKNVLLIFIITAVLWITKDLINAGQKEIKLDDTMIALMGATLLFIIPGKDETGKKAPLLEWADTKKMAWGILLLFGGGISLADQLQKAGLIQLLGGWIAGFATGGFMLVLIVTLVSIFISEVMSNVAQVIVFAPVVAGIATALHIDALQIGMAMTLGASCAGMLPMGTPPNAIVFASGRLKLRHMLVTGLVMNILSAIFISLFCWYVLPMMVTGFRY